MQIVTTKSELVWVSHTTVWDKPEYEDWKNWVISRSKLEFTTEKVSTTYWYAYMQAGCKLIENRDWDEVAARIRDGNNVYGTFMFSGQEQHIDLIEFVTSAMDEAAWDCAGETGECIDTDTERSFEDSDGDEIDE